MAATVATHPSSTTTTTNTAAAGAPQAKYSIPAIPANVSTGIAYLCNTDANRSVMCWYDNAAASQDGVTPPQATDPVGPSDSTVTWEGQIVRGIIMSSDSPTDFTTVIGPNAHSAPFQSNVGTASLQLLASPGQPAEVHYYANFDCFRDNFRVLYTDGQFGKVYSLYYCLFNNSEHGTG